MERRGRVGPAIVDLWCVRKGEPELHVEVKGTTADGAEVLLTPNEVQHARSDYPNVALFVMARIEVGEAEGGTIEAFGGEVIKRDR